MWYYVWFLFSSVKCPSDQNRRRLKRPPAEETDWKLSRRRRRFRLKFAALFVLSVGKPFGHLIVFGACVFISPGVLWLAVQFSSWCLHWQGTKLQLIEPNMECVKGVVG